MKRVIILTLVLASVAVSQTIQTATFFSAAWLDKTSLKWSTDSVNINDTLTVTTTEQYSESFLLGPGNGYISLFWKLKMRAAASDTDTVRIYLYRAPRKTTNALRWIKVDSTTHGGRGDTLYEAQTFNVGVKYATYFRFGFDALVGTPKMIDVMRNSQ